MAASFVRALQATDKFLSQVSRLPSAAKVQEQRLQVLCDIIAQGRWSAEGASDACAAINACGAFSQASKTQLLTMVAEQVGETAGDILEEGEEKKKGNIRLQDYTNLALFIPSDLWDVLLDDKRPTEDCILWLCQHCHQLGLLNPSERTYAALTCLSFWKMWKLGVPMHTKQQTVQLVKPRIKALLVHFEKQKPGNLAHRLKILPKRLGSLPLSLQKIFEKRPPVHDDEALRHSQSMPCRRTHSAATLSAAAASAFLHADLQTIKMAEADKPLVEVQQGTSSLIPAECLAWDQSDGESRPLPICNVVAPVPVAEQRKAKAKEIGQNLQKVLNKPKAGAPVADVLADLKAKLGGKAEKKDAVAPAPKPASKAKAKSAAKAKASKKETAPVSKSKSKKQKAKENKSAKCPSKRKAEEVADADSLESKVSLPTWFYCKETLAKRFPQDTKKRFSSRAYHLVYKFEWKKNGKTKVIAKLMASRMHRVAAEKWHSLFPAEDE